MGRKMAYFMIGSTGFVIGVILYVLGVFILPLLMQNMPQLTNVIKEYQYIFGALASGVLGSIIAIVIAYFWAAKSEF